MLDVGKALGFMLSRISKIQKVTKENAARGKGYTRQFVVDPVFLIEDEMSDVFSATQKLKP